MVEVGKIHTASNIHGIVVSGWVCLISEESLDVRLLRMFVRRCLSAQLASWPIPVMKNI